MTPAVLQAWVPPARRWSAALPRRPLFPPPPLPQAQARAQTQALQLHGRAIARVKVVICGLFNQATVIRWCYIAKAAPAKLDTALKEQADRSQHTWTHH